MRIYRYRAAAGKNGLNPNLGGITALARRSDSPQQFGPVRWELLIQGTDYYLDESGLWIGLATKLDQNDYLAVSYRTRGRHHHRHLSPEADRGTVLVGGVPQALDTLELIVQPQQGPELAHLPVRDAAGVPGGGRRPRAPASLQVAIYAEPLGAAALRARRRPICSSSASPLPSDAAIFDRTNRLFPRQQDPDAAQVVHDSYIIFPHLQPFADPTRLTPAEASDSLYRTPLFLLLTKGPPAKFALRLQYDATGGGDRSTLNLNALQLRENSEQLFVGGRQAGARRGLRRSPTTWAR